MGKYGAKVNEMAKKGFSELIEAQHRADRASALCKQYPERNGFVSAEDVAKSSRAKADRDEANAQVLQAQRKLTMDIRQQIAALRESLVDDVQKRYAVDPSMVDPAALELMKSGVMTSRDYAVMMDKALAEGNLTMARLVSRYAADAADARSNNSLSGRDAEAVALMAISSRANGLDGSEIVDAFDAFLFTFDRCVANPGMLSSWDEMTSGMVERF